MRARGGIIIVGYDILVLKVWVPEFLLHGAVPDILVHIHLEFRDTAPRAEHVAKPVMEAPIVLPKLEHLYVSSSCHANRLLHPQNSVPNRIP
jgi:hypothetical protein